VRSLLKQEQTKIGGYGMIVEIDESLFTKRILLNYVNYVTYQIAYICNGVIVLTDNLQVPIIF